MKRTLSLVLSVLMILSAFTFQTAFAADDIKVTINGQNLTMDQPPVLVNDRTLVPVRAIFEALGAKVDWNNDTNTATGVLGSTTVEIQIENTVAKVNGKDVTLDVPAKLISDRTLVPVRFISESLGAKVDWDNDTQTVIITTEGNNGKTLIFDDLSEFKNNVDYKLGGKLEEAGVSLSTEQDHTTGSGKSLKIDGRTQYYNRIKIVDMFPADFVGKKVVVSAYVYYVDTDADLRIGSYSETGTEFSGLPAEFEKFNIPKNTWTKVEFEVVHEKEIATMLGIDQSNDKKGVVTTMYIDDVSVKLKETSPSQGGEIKNSEGHRPVPTSFTKSKKLDDLIYYEEDKDGNEILKSLPEGEVMVTPDEFLQGTLKGASTYGKEEVVDVLGQNFTKAVKITVDQKTKTIYDIQHEIDVKKVFETNDVCVLTAYVRLISGGDNDTNTGEIQFVLENKTTYTKTLQANAKFTNEWTFVYLPFKVNSKLGDSSHVTIRVGQCAQVIEIADVTVKNYKKAVDINNIAVEATYKGSEKDAQWRKDALDRIEKIRKGDFKVIVKYKDGNVIPNADVKLDMYDHEFEWGTAITQNINNEESYQADVQKNFNSVVFEGNMKWTYYEDDKPLALQMAKSAKDLGIKNIRGHLLIWDYLPDKKSSGAPMRINDVAEDKEALLKMQKEHIDEITEAFAKYGVKEWDVLNEAMTNNYFRTKYGFEMINTWYNMAREALGKDGVLYYNDFRREKEFYEFMDEWIKNGVDFDGIGIQSHYGSPENPETINEMLDKMAKYGKRLKVTEYDFTTFDNELQANFTRDFMITSFAHEAMDGFYIWQFRAYKGNNKRIFYDENGNAKPAMEVWQDLIYNKWWTNESGKTGADGVFSARGFYGDYDVSVTANGKTKKVSVPLYKNGDNTVTVTLD